ncbi:cobyrinate a,c-diamide synthase [Ideonella sp. TBM-1]|uniref:Cobyrinate a,c-diamide synthase n=2 Tax=Ideonella livida TaxID=2707176 RepID=A0A7C9PGF7_9BURK|nr:cobyrinate a,c-diamide synthase [Ideonella livida]
MSAATPSIAPTLAPVLLIAGLASGQGKTTVVAALATALRRAGHRVRVFKSGPDFIDPMVLARASGQPVFNLDDRMVGLPESRQRVAQAAAEADVVLIEGVMGLYDGPPSAADLARGLDVPVAVVIDAGAMAQTFGALVHGLAHYPAGRSGEAPPLRLIGAIANRVGSAGHAQMLAESLNPPADPTLAELTAAATDTAPRLLGWLPKAAQAIPERHLGLASDATAEIDAALDALAASLDPALLQALLDLPRWQPPAAAAPAPAAPPALLAGRTVAVARDAAFRFLYPANLEALQALGAQLAFFSPLADEAIPEGADALWLPGGYPELYAAELAAAARWTASVQAFAQAGYPIWAECGGMMALADTLVPTEGPPHAMAGLLPGRATLQNRVAGLGVQTLSLPGLPADTPALRGHTFHYATLASPLAPEVHAQRLRGGEGEAVWRRAGLRCSFFHAYFPSSPVATAALFSPEVGA